VKQGKESAADDATLGRSVRIDVKALKGRSKAVAESITMATD